VGLFDPGVLAPLLSMQLIWYLTWVPGLEQGIVTGIAVAVAGTAAHRRAAAARRPSRDVAVEDALALPSRFVTHDRPRR
jgi:hypothetical protein